jgi:hypothetical protein
VIVCQANGIEDRFQKLGGTPSTPKYIRFALPFTTAPQNALQISNAKIRLIQDLPTTRERILAQTDPMPGSAIQHDVPYERYPQKIGRIRFVRDEGLGDGRSGSSGAYSQTHPRTRQTDFLG